MEQRRKMGGCLGVVGVVSLGKLSSEEEGGLICIAKFARREGSFVVEGAQRRLEMVIVKEGRGEGVSS